MYAKEIRGASLTPADTSSAILAAFGQVRREQEEHALVAVASRGSQRMEVSSIQHTHRQRESKSLVTAVTAELPRAARAHGANSGDVLRRALALIVNTREIERGKEMRHVVFILQSHRTWLSKNHSKEDLGDPILHSLSHHKLRPGPATWEAALQESRSTLL